MQFYDSQRVWAGEKGEARSMAIDIEEPFSIELILVVSREVSKQWFCKILFIENRSYHSTFSIFLKADVCILKHLIFFSKIVKKFLEPLYIPCARI